jgi:acyl-CoA thioester hydrolase
VIVPFDFEAQRPRRITAEEREFLDGYRDDAAADEKTGAAQDEGEAVAA